MPQDRKLRKKKPTQRRVKGCYECSQRRVSCDQGRPNCAKCLAKGLHCSGLGIRYRFEDGIASRGKFVGKTVSDIWTDRTRSKTQPTSDVLPQDRTYLIDNSSTIPCDEHDLNRSSNSPTKLVLVDPELMPSEDGISPSGHNENTLQSGFNFDRLDTVPSWKKSFITHFSTNIAPYMLAIDDSSNGWRQLILPIAIEDDVVMDAVVAASAYHVSSKSQSALSLGQSAFTKTVRGLLERQDFKNLDPMTNGFSVVAILVLLVTTMITGCSDFPILFGMLKSAFKAMRDAGGCGDGVLDEFIQTQFRKFNVYGEPMISEASGIEAIKTQALQSFDCLKRCIQRHPNHNQSLMNVKSQIEQAYNIYLRRALDELEPSSSQKLVEQFVRTADGYSPCSPGHHVLIWATFIAAAECSTQEHRTFLTARLRKFHEINGFENELKAVTLLRAIWRNASISKWTTVLPQMRTFIV